MIPDVYVKFNAGFPRELNIQVEYEILPASWTRINEE
jgi:hypothetical protein